MAQKRSSSTKTQRTGAKPPSNGKPDPDALLCALVLVPNTFARNRFYRLFEDPAMRRVRRRAYHVRSVLKQLIAKGADRAELIGRLELDDDRVLLRFRIPSMSLERSTALNAVEAAALNYAMYQAGELKTLADSDRNRVERALASLSA